jgi:predicted acetyltransferase
MIAQKLIDAMEKCCSAHALFVIVPGEQAVTEAALNSKAQQDAFKQLALEVEAEVQMLNDYLNVMASCGDMTVTEAKAAIANEIKKLADACPGAVTVTTWDCIGTVMEGL